MKLFILLFLFIVVTCQAHQSPLRMRQMARHGDPESDEPTLNEQIYEKFKKLAKKYLIELDPDLQALLIPEIYKVDHLRMNHGSTPSHVYKPAQNSFINPSSFSNPPVLTRTRSQLQQVAETDPAEADRQARLAQADKEALSKLSEEDKKLIENSLTQFEREALLKQLEDGKLNDLLPHEENRFGVSGGAITGAAAQIASSAGRYIGGKLAGRLGAKLGAAAGAYLVAAAVSQFVKKPQLDSENASDDGEYKIIPQGKEVEYVGTATYGYGAYHT